MPRLPKLEVVGDIWPGLAGGTTRIYCVRITRNLPKSLGGGKKTVNRFIPEDLLPPDVWAESQTEPMPLQFFGPLFWFYKGKVIELNPDDKDEAGSGPMLLAIKHQVLREQKQFARIQREIEAFENLDRIDTARRKKISESVQLFVWQRDQGKCVKCGSKERLEFDHIIPVASGGSNTERNIQLLCERCNREKGRNLI